MKITKRSASTPNTAKSGLTRRHFLKSTSIAAAGSSLFAPGMIKKVQAKTTAQSGVATEIKRTICSHCSVGCGIYAEVQNGVWTGQEPAFDHP
ncbi:MAG: twin-arginine translocation signal domain-containing protein, partial [Vibrio sp.]